MGDEGWGGGALFFSTDPKCLWLQIDSVQKIFVRKFNKRKYE